ncbi:MAG: hypothetical protein DWQ01_11290 [Planctomycetota bacterium]|nr:MAG: hypothetical protein DWQ01_11290 [Planctomycetota bacterium]
MRRFEYLKPSDLRQAAKLCREGESKAKAGGVDLLDLMKEGLERPARVVALHAIADDQVRQTGESLEIGAGATLADLARHPLVQSQAPALAQACKETATPQIREMATLAGNLVQRPRCWYFRSRHYNCMKTGGRLCYAQIGRHENHALFDNEGCAVVHPSNVAPALLCMNATVQVQGEQASRIMPLLDLFTPASEDPMVETTLQAGDLIHSLRIPNSELGARSAHHEVRHKQSYDWPLAMAAVNLNGSQPRMFLGGVASIPLEFKAWPMIRAWLDNPSDKGMKDLQDLAVVHATPLPDNAWRIPLLRSAVRSALRKAAGMEEES